jgi:hypothetical protein
MKYTRLLLALCCFAVFSVGCDSSGSSGTDPDPPAPDSALTLTVQWNETHQTLHGFGASGPWSVPDLRENGWSEEQIDQMADLLFSQDTDEAGDPKGIGLSLWRFVIGPGSARNEGNSCTFSGRRLETFLDEVQDGELVFDWSKQRAERRFMQKAAERGVTEFTGFSASPPVQLTKSGKTCFSDSDPYEAGVDDPNIAQERYDEFGEFLARVANHFETEVGIPFDHISLVNEPQYAGAGGWPNEELRALAVEVDQQFTAHDVSAEMEITEAASPLDLHSGNTDTPGRSNQIEYFFGEHNLQDLPNMGQKIVGHSYFNTWPVSQLIYHREQIAQKIQSVDPGLEYWQTEWMPLDGSHLGGSDDIPVQGPGRDLGMKPALFVARVMHADLAIANAASWQWWRGISGGDFKDGLVYLNEGEKEILESKMLWGVGNYSRFLRPGAVRVGVNRSDDVPLVERMKDGLAVSAYRAADGERAVAVAINQGIEGRTVRLEVEGDGPSVDAWQPYVTRESSIESRDRDLEPVQELSPDGTYTVPARSIVTFVGRQ